MFFFGLGPLMFLLPLVGVFAVFRVLSALFARSARGRVEEHEQQQPGQLPSDASARAQAKMESRVYALAYRLGGRLTVSDAVIETALSTKEAEALLDGLTDEVRVRAVVDDHGFVVYEFPEIIERLRREGK